MYIKDLESF